MPELRQRVSTVIPFPTVTIYGNHENPDGNPIPYERMTQRGKFKRHDAQRYLAWANFVANNWILQTGLTLPSLKGDYYIHVHCGFIGEKHADPDNVLKGILDSIFKIVGDKHVSSTVTFEHVSERPFVVINVYSGKPTIIFS